MYILNMWAGGKQPSNVAVHLKEHNPEEDHHLVVLLNSGLNFKTDTSNTARVKIIHDKHFENVTQVPINQHFT